MEVFFEQQKKLRARVKREIHFHLLGILLLVILCTTVFVYDIVGKTDIDIEEGAKVFTIILGLTYFIIIGSGIMYLKYIAFQETSRVKIKNWIILEIFNIMILTMFVESGTKLMLPAPFNTWTGTSFLLIVYWLPLIAYKISQIFRIRAFIRIMDTLKEPEVSHV